MSNIVIQGSATDLTVLELLSPADLFAEGGTLPVYDAINKEVAGFVADITSEAGRKEVASLAYKISQSKNFLDKLGKTYNAKLKEMPKAVDKERAAIWDKLEALQAEIRKPLTEWEEKEKTRVDAHKAAMAELEAITSFSEPPTLFQIEKRVVDLSHLDARHWEEFEEIATPKRYAAHDALMKLHETVKQAERDRLELEALRAAKAEQEAKDAEAARLADEEAQRARIEREATEKAQREAEEAIKAAQDLASKQKADAQAKAIADAAEASRRIKEAEDAKIAAEARSKLEAEQAVQRERERAYAEQKRLDDEAKARENDNKHKGNINREIVEALEGVAESIHDGQPLMKSIVIAIAKGQIPHVKISY